MAEEAARNHADRIRDQAQRCRSVPTLRSSNTTGTKKFHLFSLVMFRAKDRRSNPHSQKLRVGSLHTAPSCPPRARLVGPQRSSRCFPIWLGRRATRTGVRQSSRSGISGSLTCYSSGSLIWLVATPRSHISNITWAIMQSLPH